MTEHRDCLDVIADSLARNAETFRRHGHEGCARESEQLLERLLEAMARIDAA